jgi:16S rRNA (cytosine1402-N4)-methyltransferase
VRRVDGILFDLGVSSHQIDTPDRGFSYMSKGPLDMRMNQEAGSSAMDIVNTWSVEQLTELFRIYGEERRAPKIARRLVDVRPLDTTAALADAVSRCVPSRDVVKTLARVFQAIRIAVNDELSMLERALFAGLKILRPGGRMAVISYHSLEDRRVKRFLRYGNLDGEPVRDFYGNLITPWKLITRKLIEAGREEIAANPRARSARLRIAEKIDSSDTSI